jgi:hypothetical protein
MARTKQFLEERYTGLNVELASLRGRYDKLSEELGDCILQIDSVTDEMREIIKAANAIGLQLGSEEEIKGVKGRKTGNITIQNAVLQVLAEEPEGLTSSEILSNLKERFKIYIARTSLSPQLTRLKRRKKVALKGSVWSLHLPDDPFETAKRQKDSGSRS